MQIVERSQSAINLEQRTMIRPPEFARLIGCSRGHVYRWIYAGQLKAKLVGRAWFIPVGEVTDFFERENVA